MFYKTDKQQGPKITNYRHNCSEFTFHLWKIERNTTVTNQFLVSTKEHQHYKNKKLTNHAEKGMM